MYETLTMNKPRCFSFNTVSRSKLYPNLDYDILISMNQKKICDDMSTDMKFLPI